MSQERTASEEFEAILERFSGTIRASVLRFGLEAKGVDPEDVLQEIRMKVWKGLIGEKKIRLGKKIPPSCRKWRCHSCRW